MADLDVQRADRSKREAEVVKAAELLQMYEGDPERLATIAAQFWLAAQPTGESLEIESMVSASTLKPVVEMRWGEMRGQISPAQARLVARLLFEAAESSIADAAIYQVLSEGGSMEDKERAAGFVSMLRRVRDELGGE